MSQVVIASHGGNGEKQFDLMFLGKTSRWMYHPLCLGVNPIVRTPSANTVRGVGTYTLKGQWLLSGLLQTLRKHF